MFRMVFQTATEFQNRFFHFYILKFAARLMGNFFSYEGVVSGRPASLRWCKLCGGGFGCRRGRLWIYFDGC